MKGSKSQDQDPPPPLKPIRPRLRRDSTCLVSENLVASRNHSEALERANTSALAAEGLPVTIGPPAWVACW